MQDLQDLTNEQLDELEALVHNDPDATPLDWGPILTDIAAVRRIRGLLMEEPQ